MQLKEEQIKGLKDLWGDEKANQAIAILKPQRGNCQFLKMVNGQFSKSKDELQKIIFEKGESNKAESKEETQYKPNISKEQNEKILEFIKGLSFDELFVLYENTKGALNKIRETNLKELNGKIQFYKGMKF